MSRNIVYAFTFQNESGTQPASQLDSNFSAVGNAVKDSSNGFVNYATDTGSANAYVVTLSPVPAGYQSGFTIVMNPANSNTGASTINVNGLGSVSILRSDATAVQGGDILAGNIITIVYNGAAFVIERTVQIATPSASGLLPGIYTARLWKEDFSAVFSPIATSGSAIGSDLGWVSVLANPGAAISSGNSGVDQSNQVWGVWGASTGATNAGVAGATTAPFNPALGSLDLFFRIAFTVVPTGAQNSTSKVGVNDGITGGTNAISLEMNFDGANASWIGRCVNGGVSSTTATSTTPAINAFSNLSLTYYKVHISVNAAWSSVSFFVNGTQIGAAVTTNIPTAAGTPLAPFFACIKTAGTQTHGILIDDFWAFYNYATP